MFTPHTEAQVRAMLAALGLGSVEELFDAIPARLRRRDLLDVPPPMPEIELRRHFRELTAANRDVAARPCFLGAGIYDHYVPAAVGTVVGRSEFYTSYTPYQPEMSQGTLQAIYEFQTMIARLTGMDVANASMYDGATALAEAVLMAREITSRPEVIVARSVHPAWRRVTQTYLSGLETRAVEVGYADGALDLGALEAALSEKTACVAVQQPNFLGAIEPLHEIADRAHRAGALLVVGVNPIALGLLEPPGASGADIVVGEGQPLGLGMSFGGPLVGLFACRAEHMRRMPGRVAGATADREGRRGYTLTLQTREQHIRRERATSNICTNQGLCMLAATAYLSLMGKSGLRDVAEQCLQKAHYAFDQLTRLPGFRPAFASPFFHEFALRCPIPPVEVNRCLSEAGILGGYPLGRDYPELSDALLLCVTEQRSKEEIDHLVEALWALGSGLWAPNNGGREASCVATAGCLDPELRAQSPEPGAKRP
jgi:glycine dehydrogenase subunit 1